VRNLQSRVSLIFYQLTTRADLGSGDFLSESAYEEFTPMTEQERAILRLMYDLEVEMYRHQSDQIHGLRDAVKGCKLTIEGCERSIESLDRTHEILGKLMKATSELIGIQ